MRKDFLPFWMQTLEIVIPKKEIIYGFFGACVWKVWRKSGFVQISVCVSIQNLSYISVDGFQEFNLEVCMVSNNGAKIRHATKYCFPRTQKERQTKDDLISYVHKLIYIQVGDKHNSPCHNGNSVHKQRYCVTRLNYLRKLVCLRYCAIFQKISSGLATWPIQNAYFAI